MLIRGKVRCDKKIFKSLSFHTMRYHLRPVRMFTIKKSSNNKCWRGCGEKGTILHCWWECNTVISTIQSSMCCAMLIHSVVSDSLEPRDWIEKNPVPQWKTMHCLDSREQPPELPDSGSLAVFYNSEL